MRVTNVLAPIDFSPPSKLALDYGVAFARAFRANLTVLHVIDERRVPPSQAEMADDFRRLSELLSSEDKGDLDVRTLVKVGDIEGEILSTVHDQGIDFVVLGTHGRGLLGRALIGSVTQKLLRKLDVPVLTVCHAAGFLKFGRILFAADLSETSENAFKFALELARTRRSDLLSLHAVDYSNVNYGMIEPDWGIRTEMYDSAKRKLEDMTARAGKEGVKLETSLVQGKPAEQILKAAAENDVDLILLSVDRKSVLERALLGSTAERVVREAIVPVLLIPGVVDEAARERRAS